MIPNSDPVYRRIRRGDARGRLDAFRRSLRRSSDGKLLGVFKGIAESRGYSVCLTRTVGVIALLILAGAMGADGHKVLLLVAGFFYLLLALLMSPPVLGGESNDQPAPVAPTAWPSAPSARYPQGPSTHTRVDLAQLDRQLDGLNRRIQRMETIVTDREFDWTRRMES